MNKTQKTMLGDLIADLENSIYNYTKSIVQLEQYNKNDIGIKYWKQSRTKYIKAVKILRNLRTIF